MSDNGIAGIKRGFRKISRKNKCPSSTGDDGHFVVYERKKGSDLVNGLVVAIVDAVAAFDALDVVDGELLLFFQNGAIGAFGLAGAALYAAVSDHICHNAASSYLTSPLRST